MDTAQRPRQLTNRSNFQVEIVQPKRYHNEQKLTIIVVFLCFSSFYFGFSLAYLSSVSSTTLQKYFLINPNKITVVTGNLIGCLPLGAIVGAATAPIVLRFVSRKNFLLIFNAVAILVAGVIQINSLIVLYVCRFITGFLVGNYMAITPIYVNELVPVDIQGSYGALTQLHVVIAIVLCYLLGVIFTVANVNQQFAWRFLFSFTGITAIIQSLLLIFDFIPQSPVSLVARGQIQQAKKVLGMFNTPQVLNKVLMQTMAKVDTKIQNRPFQQQTGKQIEIQKESKDQKFEIPIIPRAMFLGFELPFMQQMSGTNMIVTQIGQIVQQYDPHSALYAPLLANIVQLIATVASVVALGYFGRRTLMLLGNFSLAVVDIIIAILFLILQLLEWTPAVYIALAFIMVFMLIYGVTIGPAVWLYVPEIIPSRFVPPATCMNWIGCSISIIVTPLIVDAVGSSYPVFFIFGGLSLIFSAINYFLVVQTKGLSLVQISKKMAK